MTLNFVGFLGSDVYSIHSDDDTYLDGSIKTIEKDFEPRFDLIKLEIENPVGKIDRGIQRRYCKNKSRKTRVF
jgi:hypothetical protein